MQHHFHNTPKHFVFNFSLTRKSKFHFVSMIISFMLMMFIFLWPAYASNIQSPEEGWNLLVNDGILEQISMGSGTFKSILYDLMATNTMTQLGSKYFNSGSNEGGTQCWGFAETVMKRLTGKGAPSGSGRTSGGDIPALRGLTKFTYDSFKNNGVPQRGATLIRTQANDYFNSTSDNGSGHSMILLYYDQKNVYYLHSYKPDNKTYRNHLTKQTWSEWTSERLTSGSRKIKYVVTFNDSAFRNKYSDIGITGSTLEFRDVKYPSVYNCTVKSGKSTSAGFSLSGIVVSDTDLVSIDAVIKKADGTPVSSMTSPYPLCGKTFLLSALDDGSSTDHGNKFSKITQEGVYYWTLTATDTKGRTLTLKMTIEAKKNVSTKSTTTSLACEKNQYAIPDFYVPNELTNIAEEAFYGIAAQRVKLPGSLQTIGIRAFASCPNLVQIYIPQSCTWIAANAFENTKGLVIYGQKGSYAESYAKTYGYTFDTPPSLTDQIRQYITNGGQYDASLDLNGDGVIDTADYIIAKNAGM